LWPIEPLQPHPAQFGLRAGVLDERFRAAAGGFLEALPG
jgi:hypothetical protein